MYPILASDIITASYSLIQENIMQMTAGQMKAWLCPESETLFFIKEAPITLEFIGNDAGKIVKFIVSESGTIVEEAQRTD